ncbi:MAG: HD domain-containing protein [Candidatus Cloacimonetes bacterium]|nr:HD domain-containing protein [Candidatus Cloacimonadota bacterium]
MIYRENARRVTSNLGDYACRDNEATRLSPEPHDLLRSAFAIDRDRILYSGAYRRNQGKTQVFAFTNLFDEEMTNRSLHTTYVAQTARRIGLNLRLNQDLIEAIALAHDLGHTPFGHDGEAALNRCCLQYGIGEFHHNIQSLHIVDNISSRGEGLDLTFQVRDGIISHDGEVHEQKLFPQRGKVEADITSYINSRKRGDKMEWLPATLEGCVVRIADTIAYIGQDIEDAIRYRILKADELPRDCREYLGNSNGKVVDTLIRSVIVSSFEQDFIAFDQETSYYLHKLKKFNYERIYTNENVKKFKKIVDRSMKLIFEQYLEDLEKEYRDSMIFTQFLDRKNEKYLSGFSNAEKVRDFISTMTDRYFDEEIQKYFLPGGNY